ETADEPDAPARGSAEGAAPAEAGGPRWRVGLVRDGPASQPLRASIMTYRGTDKRAVHPASVDPGGPRHGENGRRRRRPTSSPGGQTLDGPLTPVQSALP